MMSIGKPRFASAPAAAVRCLSESFSRAASAVARSSAFDFGSAIGEDGAMKKCEAAFAVEALDPGVPYESRWAPYVRIHGPGQGQFPKGSIRPRGYVGSRRATQPRESQCSNDGAPPPAAGAG